MTIVVGDWVTLTPCVTLLVVADVLDVDDVDGDLAVAAVHGLDGVAGGAIVGAGASQKSRTTTFSASMSARTAACPSAGLRLAAFCAAVAGAAAFFAVASA